MYKHLIALLVAIAAVASPGAALLVAMAQGEPPAHGPLVESSTLIAPAQVAAG